MAAKATEATPTRHLRPASTDDIPALAHVFISGLNTSLPDRALADEVFVYERDASPDGRLYARFAQQLKSEQVWVAEAFGRIMGYVSWTNPRTVEKDGNDTYQAGEASARYCTLYQNLINN
jgi:hypothetical protein